MMKAFAQKVLALFHTEQQECKAALDKGLVDTTFQVGYQVLLQTKELLEAAEVGDSSARGVRQPAAGVECVVGRYRRPRRRSPRAPRGYDPTPPADGPVLGRARLTPVGAGTP